MNKDMVFRHELKYLCSSAELEILKIRLSGIMKLDGHANAGGEYHIRSIYFDDLYNTSYYENKAGINGREKWRIRAYNNDASGIFLESKRKENGMIQKNSCLLAQDQFYKLVKGENIGVSKSNSKLLNRFLVLQQERRLQPKVIVGYDRRPCIYKDGNVRVTFDQNIFSSPDIDAFFSEKLRKRPILAVGMHLLEVKYDAYIPDHIFHSIQMINMQQITFSKYYLSRVYSL